MKTSHSLILSEFVWNQLWQQGLQLKTAPVFAAHVRYGVTRPRPRNKSPFSATKFPPAAPVVRVPSCDVIAENG